MRISVWRRGSGNSAAALAFALAATACATGLGTHPAPGDADAAVLRAPELARVRCLLVAPLENASDAPLAAWTTTAGLAAAVDPTRARVLPVAELRGLFRETPMELPEGIGPGLALELAEILGADAALYGAVEGSARAGADGLVVTLRLVLGAERALLFAASGMVHPAPGEPPDLAARRTAVALAAPALARLGDPGRKHCFDPGRLEAVRAVALASSSGTHPVPAPAPAPPTAPALTARTPRQQDWSRRLQEGTRFVVEDVAFAGRTAQPARDAGLVDLAAALKAAPGARVRLEAFVDGTADRDADARLAQAMAAAAVKRLAELGVARDRVTFAGRGGESPLLPNFTLRGRAANRRIEVVGSGPR